MSKVELPLTTKYLDSPWSPRVCCKMGLNFCVAGRDTCTRRARAGWNTEGTDICVCMLNGRLIATPFNAISKLL